MLVTLPVIFEAHVVPKGARSSRPIDFVERDTFEILECSEQEAPVAIRALADFQRTGTYTRWHEGRHFVRDGHERDPAFDHDKWSSALLTNGCPSAAWRKLLEATGRSRVHADRELATRSLADMRSVEQSTFDMDRSLVATMADDLLLVDGKLYRAVATPLYVLGGISDSSAAHSFGTEGIRNFAAHQRPTDVFAMDRLDDMIAHAEEHYPNMEDLKQAEVLIPESCRANDEQESLILAAGVCVEMLENRLKMLDEFQGPAWFRLRAAVADGSTDRIENAVREFADTCASTQEDHEGLVSDMEDARTTAERSLSRWAIRPLDMHDDPLRL